MRYWPIAGIWTLHKLKTNFLIDMHWPCLMLEMPFCASKGAGRVGVLLYLDLWGVLCTILLYT
ncbi:hypothetical protein BDW72DRAFT_177675 [Aspergillus terricola var. indicus]